MSREKPSSSGDRPAYVWQGTDLGAAEGEQPFEAFRRPAAPTAAAPATAERASSALAVAQSESGPEQPNGPGPGKPDAAPDRGFRPFGRILLAGAGVAALAGGTIGVINAVGGHSDTAAVTAAGATPTQSVAPFSLPSIDPTPTAPAKAKPSAKASSAAPTKAATTAHTVVAQPTVTEPPAAGVWALSGDALDSSGSANGVASNVSFSGGAAVFSGANDSDINTDSPVLQTGPGSSFTVSAWVDLTSMPTSASRAATAVSQGAGIDSAFYLQYFEPENRWAFARMDTDTELSNAARTLSQSTAQTDVWTHLVGVFDASGGAVRLYVNGTLQGTTTDPSPFASTQGLEIGGARYSSTGSDGFTGQIKDVRAFGEALSAREVAALD